MTGIVYRYSSNHGIRMGELWVNGTGKHPGVCARPTDRNKIGTLLRERDN